MPNDACQGGDQCVMNEFCKDCDSLGFCVPAGPPCGGFIGRPCPQGQACLAPGGCIADASGSCIPEDWVDPICEMQPGCWTICP
jgi:hypothetical protein